MEIVTVSDPASFPSAFDHALNTANIDLLLKLYEPDASFRASDGSVQEGQQALRREMEMLIAAKANLHNQLRHVLQSGTTALIIVDWTLALDLPAVGSVNSEGTATNVLRYADGHGWRMLIANPQGAA